MRKSGICWAVLIFLASGTLSTAHAGPNANAKILLHLLAPTTKNACTRAAAAPTCSEIVTAGALYPQAYFAYLLVTDADSTAGVAGVQCGISYNGAPSAGVEIYSWTNCATLEFSSGGWPMSGSGNLITWDSTARCQRNQPGGPGTGVVAVAGYFYCAAYGSDTLRITIREVDGTARVASCAAIEDVLDSIQQPSTPSPLGFAVFSPGGTAAGYNPCGLAGGQGLVSPPGDGAVGDTGVTTFVQLDTTNETFLSTVASLRETYHATVLVGIFPDGIICQFPDTTFGSVLEQNAHVVAVSRSAIKQTKPPTSSASNWNDISAVDVWNELVKNKSNMVIGTASQFGECGGTVNETPQVAEHGARELTRGGLQPQSVWSPYPAYHTSDYMMGDIGVSVILAESNATGSCPTENWDSIRILRAASEVVEATEQLALLAPPSAGLTFFVEQAVVGHTDEEPAHNNLGHLDWLDDVFDDVGWGSDRIGGGFGMCNYKRSQGGFDWHMALIIASGSCPENQTFGDSNSGGFAHLGGPYAVALMIGTGLDLDKTIIHETCHVFGAADEYEGAPTCDSNEDCGEAFGYLHVVNANCRSCIGNANVPCLMHSLDELDAMCTFTRGQIGWTNIDGTTNEFLDPIDHPDSGRRMLISNPQLTVGDVVDIYDKDQGIPLLQFTKRLAVTERNLDHNSIAWDGMSYAGYPVVPYFHEYEYSINNGPRYDAGFVSYDNVAPTRNAPANVVLHMPPETPNEQGPHDLRVSFTDSDTRGCNVIVTLSQVGEVVERWNVVTNEFIRDAASQTWHEWSFLLPEGAGTTFILGVQLVDVGGRHNLNDFFSFQVTGVSESGVNVAEPLSVRAVSGNPTDGGVRWEIASDKSQEASVYVLDVQGRIVHQMQLRLDVGRTIVAWNGRAVKGKVAAGKYYVRVVTDRGVTASGEIVIVR